MIATGMMPKRSWTPSMCGLLRALGALCGPGDLQGEAVDGRDLDRLARRHRPVLAHRPPQLAVDQHLPLGSQGRPRHPAPPPPPPPPPCPTPRHSSPSISTCPSGARADRVTPSRPTMADSPVTEGR